VGVVRHRLKWRAGNPLTVCVQNQIYNGRQSDRSRLWVLAHVCRDLKRDLNLNRREQAGWPGNVRLAGVLLAYFD
jgi:hypothetical protein